MRSPKGRDLAERLIARCDVVSENFAPGVMERWGLTYERLDELSPEVIYARMSGYGHSGPHAEYRSYGPVVQAVSGLSYISGLPGQEPSGWGLSYMDNQAAYYNSRRAADRHLPPQHHRQGHRDRRLRRRGRHQPASGRSCSTSPSTATRPGAPTSRPATGSSGRTPRRTACTRRSATTAGSPSPCSTTHAMGRSGARRWAARRGPTTPGSRRQEDRFAHQDAARRAPRRVDRGAATATSSRELLQRHGVPAGAVQDAEDLNERDPQIAHARRVLRDGPSGDRQGPLRGHARSLLAHRAGQLALGAAARRGQRLRVHRDPRPLRRRVASLPPRVRSSRGDTARQRAFSVERDLPEKTL